ncbi:PHP domain-containing protein [Plantibacter sp. VKM Ac-2880]|uniref:PHP domain-containing protein n=1 Tax=Plantibacter sp. VKM Ac-2880 TaxID=2783827 RepID=UPI00189026D9|nr:PHP domain-containing protein [Plantibacter sp. VKM Ac-2880]MBF4568715.1 PHP domain-containing protein [Plantibacter sp. VKM Ac-2880]
MHGPADLHTHSSVSDGTETPTQLMRAAGAAGLGTIALTDHDSTAGWAEASVESRRQGITLLPGMELSTRYEWRSVHLLAYLIDPLNGDLLQETAKIRESRLRRAEAIVARIGGDYPLSWADVLAQTREGATVGRPHIADALIALGIVADRGEAFDGILHPRTGYYAPHYAPDPLTAVRLVRAAGGVPVIAHPVPAGRDRMLPEPYFRELADAGLFGLEIEHRENTEEGKVVVRRIASELGLVATGSSDYHGTGKPNRLGENTTDMDVVRRIVDEATGSEPVLPN